MHWALLLLSSALVLLHKSGIPKEERLALELKDEHGVDCIIGRKYHVSDRKL